MNQNCHINVITLGQTVYIFFFFHLDILLQSGLSKPFRYGDELMGCNFLCKDVSSLINSPGATDGIVNN